MRVAQRPKTDYNGRIVHPYLEHIMTSDRHVFISYARKDGELHAIKLEQGIVTDCGLKTLRDKRDIDPTQDFSGEIEKAIEAASHMVVCITSDVRRGDSFVRREIGYAQALKKAVIVARFEDVVPPIQVVTVTGEVAEV